MSPSCEALPFNYNAMAPDSPANTCCLPEQNLDVTDLVQLSYSGSADNKFFFAGSETAISTYGQPTPSLLQKTLYNTACLCCSGTLAFTTNPLSEGGVLIGLRCNPTGDAQTFTSDTFLTDFLQCSPLN
jgi:hypothetical protein